MVKCASCGSELDVISSVNHLVFTAEKEYPKGFRIEMDGEIYEVISTRPHGWAGIIKHFLNIPKVDIQR